MNFAPTNPTPIRRRPASPARQGRAAKRRGVAVGFLIVTLVFLAGFVALGLNTSRLMHTKAELRAVCQSAALAGARELLDEGVLYGYPDKRDDVLMAREAARLLGRANRVDGRVVVLDPNPKNLPLGDVVVGTVDPLGPVGLPLGLPVDPEKPQAVNTVRVSATLNDNVFNRVSLWLGKLTGVLTADTAATAQATLDTRIAGFKPERGVKAPVVPLAAEYGAWLKQAEAEPVAGVNDRFTVNPQTGQVTSGPDGIPEIVLNCGPNPPPAASRSTESTEVADAAPTDDTSAATAESEDAADESAIGAAWCVALDLVNDQKLPYIWPVRCREGLSIGDLSAVGGQLVLAGGALVMPRVRPLPDEVPYGLMDIVGQSRAWPLFEGYTEGDAPTCTLVGFAAARILTVAQSPDGSWELVAQPTTMVSSQAVTAPYMNSNPWIGKLELTQ